MSKFLRKSLQMAVCENDVQQKKIAYWQRSFNQFECYPIQSLHILKMESHESYIREKQLKIIRSAREKDFNILPAPLKKWLIDIWL